MYTPLKNSTTRIAIPSKQYISNLNVVLRISAAFLFSNSSAKEEVEGAYQNYPATVVIIKGLLALIKGSNSSFFFYKNILQKGGRWMLLEISCLCFFKILLNSPQKSIWFSRGKQSSNCLTKLLTVCSDQFDSVWEYCFESISTLYFDNILDWRSMA